MAALSDDTRIMTKHKCPDCYLGKVPHEDSSKVYDYTYCPSCEGTGWIKQWASLTDICRATNRINSMLSCAK
jgi:hypothetical protein